MFWISNVHYSLAKLFISIMLVQHINALSIADLYPKGIHGIKHAYRVYLLIQKLCDKIVVSQIERLQLEYCAFFHDIGRVNDFIDDTHGIRSYEKLINYNFLGLDKFNNTLVQYIIENHCLNDEKAIYNLKHYEFYSTERAQFLLFLFKDADGLDRIRLGDFEKKYLRNTCAEELIDFAKKINNEAYSIEFISRHIYSWLKRGYKV